MFSKRLKSLRKSQEITQDQLADYLNVSKQSVWGYENNSVEPSFDVLIKIADRFNVSLDYLLCRSDQKYNISLMDSSSSEFLEQFYELINSYKILKK